MVNAVGAVVGGAARHLPPFVSALCRARPDWEIVVCLSAGSPNDAGQLGVPIVRRVKSDLRTRLGWEISGIETTARMHRIDCILNLTNHGPRNAPMFSVLYQRNPIYFDPAWLAKRSPRERIEARMRRQLAFKEMAASDVVVTPSDAMGSFLRSWGPGSRLRIVTVPHAVDAKTFTCDPRPLDLSGHVSLLVVSHPGPHKGLETAVRVLKELRLRYLDASLTLTIDSQQASASHQRYVDGLVGLARRLGVSDHVSFVGAVSHVESLYHEHDLLLFPSYTESFGFPILEAMSSGLPVIASSIPSTVEILSTMGSYFVPGSYRGAAGQIYQLGCANTDLARSRLLDARSHAMKFTWGKNAGTIAGLVDQGAAGYDARS